MKGKRGQRRSEDFIRVSVTFIVIAMFVHLFVNFFGFILKFEGKMAFQMIAQHKKSKAQTKYIQHNAFVSNTYDAKKQ